MRRPSPSSHWGRSWQPTPTTTLGRQQAFRGSSPAFETPADARWCRDELSPWANEMSLLFYPLSFWVTYYVARGTLNNLCVCVSTCLQREGCHLIPKGSEGPEPREQMY